MQRSDGRFARVFTPLTLFALAFGVRCLPLSTVFLPAGTAFVDPDSYYHMRRIAYSVTHFPKSLGFDPYINHPHGGQPIWTPLFDWCVAALLRPFRAVATLGDFERAVVFVPPLLGAATVVTLYFVARRHFDAATATLAGIILSLLSAHFWYSQVAFLDHHAAEALVAAAILGAAMTLLARAEDPGASRSAMRRSALATGVGLGTALLVWPGMLVHVALLELGLVGFLLTRRDREQARAFALRLAALHLVALALVAPLALSARWTVWKPFSPVVLSAFQPWLLAVACLWSVGCAAAWRLDAAGRTRPRRVVSSVALALALRAAGAGALPGFLDAVDEPWEWFAGEDPFQRTVGESMPLFVHEGRPSLRIALIRLSAFFLLVPVALGVGVRSALRTPRPAALLLFYGWTTALVAATVVQRRFFNAGSVGVAVLFALTMVRSHRALVRRLPRARIAVAAAVSAAGLALLLPTLEAYLWDATNQLRVLRGVEPRLTPRTQDKAILLDLCNWIRTHTPTPSPWLDVNAKPEYGILAVWWHGHMLEYQARRATVADNFGNDIGSENYQLAIRYFLSDEASAARILEDLSVRYVVTQREIISLGERPGPESMGFALFGRDGTMARSDTEGFFIPAVERHRLIHETPPLRFTNHPKEPGYKLFEFVRGALIVGESTPGARIRAMLEVRSNRGRRFFYTASVTAAADGRYALRVPYATHGGPTEIRVAPAYVMTCGEDEELLRVDEAAVREGAEVVGPRLCAPDGDATDGRNSDRPAQR
jgi:dolichyl-diphosphooligosaccharide--protein glycosyltransferase